MLTVFLSISGVPTNSVLYFSKLDSIYIKVFNEITKDTFSFIEITRDDTLSDLRFKDRNTGTRYTWNV